MYEIKTEDVYEDFSNKKKMFDFSKNENIMIIQNSKKINGW